MLGEFKIHDKLTMLRTTLVSDELVASLVLENWCPNEGMFQCFARILHLAVTDALKEEQFLEIVEKVC